MTVFAHPLDMNKPIICYPSLYAGYKVSVRRTAMNHIVLLTLVAPRGVTDLYIS